MYSGGFQVILIFFWCLQKNGFPHTGGWGVRKLRTCPLLLGFFYAFPNGSHFLCVMEEHKCLEKSLISFLCTLYCNQTPQEHLIPINNHICVVLDYLETKLLINIGGHNACFI